MSKSPECIILVVCKPYNNSIVEILKEYLNSVPHIKYIYCKLDSKDTCYILPYNRIFCDILNYISVIPYPVTRDSISFMRYDLGCCTSLYDAYYQTHYVPSHNTHYLPYRIAIDSKTKRKLITIIED